VTGPHTHLTAWALELAGLSPHRSGSLSIFDFWCWKCFWRDV